MPVAETELKYRTPYELMVAVILSAQCTDKRVNIITEEFFKQFPTVEILAEADTELILELIKSCSYPNNKAKHLSGMAKMLVEEFNPELSILPPLLLEKNFKVRSTIPITRVFSVFFPAPQDANSASPAAITTAFFIERPPSVV